MRTEKLWGRPSLCVVCLRLFAVALAMCSLLVSTSSGQTKKGVPAVVARKPPAPPSGPTPRAADGKVDLSGIWVPDSILLPGDPSYQPWAKKLYEERKANKGADDPERLCLPDGAVRVNPLPYKIVQGPKMVVLLWEGNTHSYRRFFLDGRVHNFDVEPESWTGQSIGKWEGDTLVVQTIGFKDQGWIDEEGTPVTNAARLTERLRRLNYGTLEVEITVDDPKTFTRPWSFKLDQRLMPDTELIEFVCLENNTSLKHLVGQ